jgi:hypothetical protein
MTASINGTAGITFNDGSVLGSQLGIFNRIIDGGFTINQRGYVSGTSLPSGTYGHDRWKGGASAGTYTFTQGALGVNTTITITAGSIIQVIEGCNLPEGGTYVLSWTGTAQGRLNGGTFGSSGTVTVTGWVAGTNLNVEFNTGTCGNVQLVASSAVSSYAYRPYGTELALCQRYLPAFKGDANWFGFGTGAGTTVAYCTAPFPVTARVAPTGVTVSNVSHFNVTDAITLSSPATAITINSTGTSSALLSASVSAGVTVARPTTLYAISASANLYFTGCEL